MSKEVSIAYQNTPTQMDDLVVNGNELWLITRNNTRNDKAFVGTLDRPNLLLIKQQKQLNYRKWQIWPDFHYPGTSTAKEAIDKYKLFLKSKRAGSLRQKVIRLAHANPEMRPHLLPLLDR